MHTHRHRPTSLLIVLLLLSGVLAACGDDDAVITAPPSDDKATTTVADQGEATTTSSTESSAKETAETTPTTGAPPTKTTTPASTTTVTVAPKTTEPATGLDPAAPSNYGTTALNAGFTPDPHTEAVASGGPVDASTVGCAGYVTAAPDMELDWNGSGFLRVFFESSDGGDTTLIVNDASGNWHCGDDSFGTLHPTIDFTSAPSGVYDIWIGSYSQGDNHGGQLFITELSAAEPGLTATALDPTLAANYGTVALNGGFTPDPTTVQMVSGGAASASEVGCLGYVSQSPDLELQWNGAGFLRFYFQSVNNGDTTLVINDPAGQWYCGDDSFGSIHPTIDFNSSMSGTYDIWVGSYSQGDSHSGLLHITELSGNQPGPTATTQPPSGLQLRPDRTAPYGEVDLTPGFSPDPDVTTITSGGQVDVSYVGCAGYAATRPDLEITLTAMSNMLRFYFIPDGNTDTTLIINAPDGTWRCGDDSYGTFHPTIEFTPAQSGVYDIWVGTYSQGDNQSGRLYITELDGYHP